MLFARVIQVRRVDANAVEVKKWSCTTGVLSICGGEIEQASAAKLLPATKAAIAGRETYQNHISHPQSIG